MMKISKNGFTIVELLLYIGLLAIFLAVLIDILVNTLAVKLEAEAVSSVHQDGRFIQARLFYDVSRASSISLPANLGDTGNALNLIIDGQLYSYTLSGDNLVLNSPSGIANLNGSETILAAFSVAKIGTFGRKPTVRILFTLQSQTRRAGGPETRNFQTAVGLR